MRLIIALATALLSAPLFAQQAVNDDDAAELSPVRVQAARTGQPDTALPYTVTVITREELDTQLALGTDIAALIGQAVPSYSPSRQKMSGFGETLRGRSPLILIDGIPQSTPLRDGSRDTYVIDPEMIERIEILHGANAIQGTGATGGIINFVTRRSSSGQPAEIAYSVAARANDDFDSDSFGGRLHGRYAGMLGELDLLVGAGLEKTGMFFDAEDRLIAVDNTQGDIMDSTSQDFFGKLGYSFGDQRLQFTVNVFELENDADWVTVPGDQATGLPATSERGTVPGDPAENSVLNLALDYAHESLGPGRLHWQLYHQDFDAIYGGGVFGVFQDPALGADFFDQSRNRSSKLGAKLTYNLPDWPARDFDLTLGLDYLEDTTEQDLVQSGRSWVPETNYVNWAPFAQGDWQLGNVGLTAGIRREEAKLDVDDFTTLAAYDNTFVAGGSPDFGETLVNAGFNWRIADAWTAFGVYSEGFTMPDAGRVLRGISTPGLDIDQFLDLQPVVADNIELGLQWRTSMGHLRASYWVSDSDLGSRLLPDEDGIFSVQREKTELQGWEIDGAVYAGDRTRLTLAYARTDGEFDSDGDGRVDADLGGTNISPDRLNLGWERDWSGSVRSRLQLSHYFDRDFRAGGTTTAEFDGYTILDLIVGWQLNASNSLTLAVENLADKQYITYYSQVYAFAGDSGFFAGRGRQLALTWRSGF